MRKKIGKKSHYLSEERTELDSNKKGYFAKCLVDGNEDFTDYNI